MDHRGGGNNNRTDLLAAGRKKLQQFRKKKEKRAPGKKAKSDAEAGEGSAKADEADPKSPVGLKLLAGEGGSSGDGDTPFEEAERPQYNGEGPDTADSSSVENADVVHVQEASDGCDSHNVGASEQGTSELEGPGLADGEDPAIQATSGEASSDAVEGPHQDAFDVSEELPDHSLKENVELQAPSQSDGADANHSQPEEYTQLQVEMDFVGRATSSDSKEVAKVPIPS